MPQHCAGIGCSFALLSSACPHTRLNIGATLSQQESAVQTQMNYLEAVLYERVQVAGRELLELALKVRLGRLWVGSRSGSSTQRYFQVGCMLQQ